jgi:predicted DNA-binding protein YlxM (UPF0122 family)
VLEKIDDLIMLYDFYGPLLTERQRQAVQLHYEADLSLSEVALEMAISRQGVYDLLQRSEKLLRDYEGKLGLVAKFQRERQRIGQACQILNDIDVQKSREILEVVKILEEVLEMESVAEGSY